MQAIKKVSFTEIHLRAARAALGLTLDQLAAATGLGRVTLLRLEKATAKPRPETVSILVSFFGEAGIEMRADGIRWQPGLGQRPLGGKGGIASG